MFCPKCGTQVTDGAAFCDACGANLKTGKTTAPSIKLPEAKTVSWKDTNFVFVALAGLLALISTILMHCPVIAVGVKGAGAAFSASCTLLDAGKIDLDKISTAMAEFFSTQKLNIGSQAVGQIIFTILVFAAVAYLFLPYIKAVNMKMSVLNFAVPAVILLAQLVFFIIAAATNPMGEIIDMARDALLSQSEAQQVGAKISLGLSMDGWLFYLTNIASMGILAWQTVKAFLKK